MHPHIEPLFRKGPCLFLAYDQGLEHGPDDFSDENIDPKSIIRIAKQGKYDAMIFQKGIAERYHKEIISSRVPLILKLNGKTNLSKGEPLSTQLCTVREAIKLGASAVGYTIYIGSEHEAVMFHEFAEIEREAHLHGLPVIAWIYPRGKAVEGKDPAMLLAYAARVGLELGADIVKIHWTGSVEDLAWAVKAAGKTRVVIAGGARSDQKTFLKHIKEALSAGVSGLAVGRNIWQARDPLALTKRVREILTSVKR